MKDKKRAMGRGLGAILSAESKANVNTATDEGADRFVGNIVEVSIDDISPNPGQPRTHFDQDALESLAASIRALGIIQPITLRKDGEKLIIISGERRFRASVVTAGSNGKREHAHDCRVRECLLDVHLCNPLC